MADQVQGKIKLCLFRNEAKYYVRQRGRLEATAGGGARAEGTPRGKNREQIGAAKKDYL